MLNSIYFQSYFLCTKINKKQETYFHRDGLQIPEFGQWLHDVKDNNTSAKCKICHKKIKLSTMGMFPLSDYVNGSKYLIQSKKVTTFIGKGTISLKQSFDPPTS